MILSNSRIGCPDQSPSAEVQPDAFAAIVEGMNSWTPLHLLPTVPAYSLLSGRLCYPLHRGSWTASVKTRYYRTFNRIKNSLRPKKPDAKPVCIINLGSCS
jgi:hypothetical protein